MERREFVKMGMQIVQLLLLPEERNREVKKTGLEDFEMEVRKIFIDANIFVMAFILK